jgi:uncharacterized membrane protein
MLTTQTRLFYALMLFGYFGIMALLLAWYGWLAPPSLVPAQLALVALGLPLFAPLRGLLHARRYTVAWSLYLCLLYFTHGIVEAYSDAEARCLALTEVALSLCWLLAGIAFIRASKPIAADSPGR